MMQEFVQEIQNTVQRGLRGIHTAMPGQIVSFDAAKGVATVKPAMKFKKPDGTTVDFPITSDLICVHNSEFADPPIARSTLTSAPASFATSRL